jgi:hypothetical protein
MRRGTHTLINDFVQTALRGVHGLSSLSMTPFAFAQEEGEFEPPVPLANEMVTSS